MANDLHRPKVTIIPDSFEPINSYISEQTDGLIRNIFGGDIDEISNLTLASMANAVYLEGKCLGNLIQEKQKKAYCMHEVQ